MLKRSLLVLTMLSLSACSGGSSVSPTGKIATPTPTPAPTSTPASVPAASSQSALMQFSVTVPKATAASANRQRNYLSALTHAIKISSNGTVLGSLVFDYALLDATSPACTVNADGTSSCSVTFPVPIGNNQSFVITAYDNFNKVTSAQTIVASIVAGASNTIRATLGGTPSALGLALAKTFTAGVAASTNVYVSALDASGEVILGPTGYTGKNASPITIALQDSDTSGHTALSVSRVTVPGQTVMLSYDGSASPSALISAIASGLSTRSIDAFGCAPANANEFAAAILNLSTGFQEIARFPLAGAGTQMTSEAPLVGPDSKGLSGVLTDAAGDLYANGSTAFEEFCPGATGTDAPIAQFASGAAGIDPAGDVFVATSQYGSDNPKYAPVILEGFDRTGTVILAPTNVTEDEDFTGVASDDATVYVGTGASISMLGTTRNPSEVPSSFSLQGVGLVNQTSSTVDRNGNVYVIYSVIPKYDDMPLVPGTAAIAEYNSNGTLLRTIRGDQTQLTYSGSIAVDASGTITIVNRTTGYLATFGPTQSGNVAPTSTNVPAGGYLPQFGIDGAGNDYLSSGTGFAVYNASGTLMRQVDVSSGPLAALAIDAAGDVAYITGKGVYELPANATSSSGATTIASAPNIQNAGGGPPDDLAIDASSGAIAVLSGSTVSAYAPFSSTATRTLDVGAHASSISEDASGNVYVGGDDAVLEYASTANGAAAPIAGFDDASVSSEETSIGVDAKTGDVIVASCVPVALGIFAPGLTGAPIRVIAGWKTTLERCPGVPMMDKNGALYVPDAGRVLEFAAGASGNVAPIGVIANGESAAAAKSRSPSLVDRTTRRVRTMAQIARCELGAAADRDWMSAACRNVRGELEALRPRHG